jgi:hypothetical protein
MNRRLRLIILFVVVPVSALLIVIVAIPSLRFNLFRMVTELPAIATHFSIQKHVKAHDFAASAAGLERQLSIVKMAGTRRNSMVRGLIRNTKMVMGVADLAKDYAAMRPYLERFAAYQPQLFIGHIWLAQALSYTDPSAALPHLEEAARLVPSDDRAYRIAVGVALALGDAGKARKWCRRYATATFGGLRPLIYRNIFAGTGMRKIAIEISNDAGILVRIPNEGVQLGKSKIYDFDLPERVTVEILRLHLGLMPGVRVALETMTLYGPSGKTGLMPEDLIILPAKGFVLENGKLLTVSPDGDVLTIRRRQGTFGPMDRIDIRLSFERAGLATLPGCEGR